MPDKAIVGFIDILGYSSLVQRYKDDIESIKNLEAFMRYASVGLKEDLLQSISKQTLRSKEYDKYAEDILNAISVRLISDTILYTLPLSEITFSHPQFTQSETISNCLHFFFKFVSRFCVTFIGKTGYVLRGGISIGSHYESESDEGGRFLFMFSKAYLNAYDQEKKAKDARIVIDSNLWSYLEELSFEENKEFFYKDQDGKRCLEFYVGLLQGEDSRMVLSDIKEGLTRHLDLERNYPDALSKLLSFAKYHNKRVSNERFNHSDLTIDTSTYEGVVS